MDDKPKKKRTLSKLAIDELKQIQKQQIQPPIDEPNKIATKGKGEPISTDKPVSKYIADIFAGEQSPEQAKGDATPDNLKKLFATDISKIPVKDVEGKEVSQDIVKLSKPQDFFTKQNQIEDDARDKLEKGLEQLDNLDPKGLLNTVNGLIGATALPFTTLDNILRHLPKGGTDFHGKPNYGVGDYIADVIGSPAKLVEQLYPFVKGSVKSGFNIGGGAVPIMAEYVKDRYDISGESPEVDEFAKNILTILAYSGLTKIGDTYKGKNLKDPAILNSIKNDLNSGVKVGKIIETLEQDKKITEKAIDEATTPEERLSALNTAKKITEKQEELKETLLTPSEQLLKELKGEKKTGETKSNEETKVEAKPTVEEKPAEVKKQEEVKPTKVEESVSKDAPILDNVKQLPNGKWEVKDADGNTTRFVKQEDARAYANKVKEEAPVETKVEEPPVKETPINEGSKRPKKTNESKKVEETPVQKYRVDRSPQTWTLVEEEPRQKGDLPEERFFKLKNDKTGKVERFESADLKPVKEKKETSSTEQRQIERIQKQIEKIQKQAGDNEIAKDEARLRINKLKTRLEQIQEPRSLSSDMADYIVGEKDVFDKLENRSEQLESRIDKAREREPYVANSLKRDFKRGANEIRSRIDLEVKKGNVSREEQQAVEHFIDLVGDSKFEDVGVSVRKEGKKQGMYEFGKNLATLFRKNLNRGVGFTRGFTHELWHSLSRFLPEEYVDVVNKMYEKERDAYIKSTRKEANKQGHSGFIEKDSGTFRPENYRFKDIDEWFAETMTDKTLKEIEENYKAIHGTIPQKTFLLAKQIWRASINAINKGLGRVTAERIFSDYLKGDYRLERDTNLKHTYATTNLDNPVKEAVDKAKEYSKIVWDKYTTRPEHTNFRSTLGQFSFAKNDTAFKSRELEQTIKRQVPNGITREAITNYIQADGDIATLKDWENKAKVDSQRAGYRKAQNLSAEEKQIAKSIKSYYDQMLQEGIKNGLLKEGIENYVNQIWRKNNPVTGKLINEFNSTLNTNFNNARQRIFKSFSEGEQLGHTPLTKDIAKLVGLYNDAFGKSIASREFIKNLSEGKAKDGRPLVAPTGKYTLIDGSEGTGDVGLITPHAKLGDTKDYITDFTHPALNNWKYAGTAPDGTPALIKGDLALHPDIAKHVENILRPSALNKIAGVQAFTKLQSNIKSLGFALSPFHIVQEGTHAYGHKVNPLARITRYDPENPQHQEFLKHGLQLYDYSAFNDFREGWTGDWLNKLKEEHGAIGKLSEWATAISDFTFEDYIPSLKLETAKHIFERNTKRYSGKLSKEQILDLSMEQTNGAYGHLNYTLLGRNPTAQHIFRIIALAPDFLEARARFVGQGLKPYGQEQRFAILNLALQTYIGARITNKILDDDYHWDTPFEVVYKGQQYGLRSVPADILHMVTEPRRFLAGRLSPFLVGVKEALEKKDYTGTPVEFSDNLTDLMKRAIPMTLRSTADQDMFDSLLNSLGFRNKKYFSPTQRRILDTYYEANPRVVQTEKHKERTAFKKELDLLKDKPFELRQKLSEGIEKNYLSPKDIQRWLKGDNEMDISMLKHLDAYRQEELVKSMSMEDLERYKDVIKNDVLERLPEVNKYGKEFLDKHEAINFQTALDARQARLQDLIARYTLSGDKEEQKKLKEEAQKVQDEIDDLKTNDLYKEQRKIINDKTKETNKLKEEMGLKHKKGL